MSPEPLVIATGNRHKFHEIAAFLEGIPQPLAHLTDFPALDPPVEDGVTFEANATLKARYYSQRFGLACVADDSGIIVDALEGAPGVYSARYAGEGCTDADNNAKLLKALEGVPVERRGGRFVCCAALVTQEGRVHVETGVVEGHIAHGLHGKNGFGYDPLFIPEGYEQTFGQLGPSIKAEMSHRSRAFRQMRAYLESLP